MDLFLLSKVNQMIKKERPVLNQNTICTYYYENHYLEISFENGQCSNDALGTCTMCDYGIATLKENVSIFLEEMCRIYYSIPERIDSLMLCTNGSFLDDTQIPLEFQKKIMEEANNLPCKTILFETHYATINDSKLALIKKTIKNKEVKIELGLETINTIYQKYILNKNISLEKLKIIIRKILHYGFIPSLNILIGIPFLTEKEQVRDALDSITWCMQQNTEIVLFPLNIKPYTLLYHLYENNMCQPISHWLLIYVLALADENYLSKIHIAFWGNRDDSYGGKNIIFPSSCEKCCENVMNFFSHYLSTNNYESRKTALYTLIKDADCDCFKHFKKKLVIEAPEDIDTRLTKLYAYLKQLYAERICHGSQN